MSEVYKWEGGGMMERVYVDTNPDGSIRIDAVADQLPRSEVIALRDALTEWIGDAQGGVPFWRGRVRELERVIDAATLRVDHEAGVRERCRDYSHHAWLLDIARDLKSAPRIFTDDIRKDG